MKARLVRNDVDKFLNIASTNILKEFDFIGVDLVKTWK